MTSLQTKNGFSKRETRVEWTIPLKKVYPRSEPSSLHFLVRPLVFSRPLCLNALPGYNNSKSAKFGTNEADDI